MSGRLLVFGSRTWGNAISKDAAELERVARDRSVLFRALDTLAPDFVIAGGAKGADTLAEVWAVEHSIPRRIYIAEWTRLGRGAGPVRNQLMLDDGNPDRAVGFISGNGGAGWSKGSADMVRRVRWRGVALAIYRDNGLEVDWPALPPGAAPVCAKPTDAAGETAGRT